MNKTFLDPEIEIFELKIDDIIRTSNGDENKDGPDDGGLFPNV